MHWQKVPTATTVTIGKTRTVCDTCGANVLFRQSYCRECRNFIVGARPGYLPFAVERPIPWPLTSQKIEAR